MSQWTFCNTERLWRSEHVSNDSENSSRERVQKSASLLILCICLPFSGNIFSEFELENSPYKLSSSDNKLVKSVWKIQYTEETTNKS